MIFKKMNWICPFIEMVLEMDNWINGLAGHIHQTYFECLGQLGCRSVLRATGLQSALAAGGFAVGAVWFGAASV